MENSGIIYLVRHCATRNDAANYPVFLGQGLNYALSDVGIEYAQTLGEHFAGRNITHIYCSPSGRAVQTARIINDAIGGKPMTFCSSVEEVDLGAWEGRTKEEVMRDDVANYERFLRDPGTYGYPDGETMAEAASRGFGFLNGLARRHANHRVIVVSHKHLNRAVLSQMQALPMYRSREIDQDPGCVNVIRVFRGVMSLCAVNYTDDFNLAEEEDEHDLLQSPVPRCGCTS